MVKCVLITLVQLVALIGLLLLLCFYPPEVKGQLFSYKPTGAVDGQGILREVLSRTPRARELTRHDPATQCHEGTHFVNSEIRNYVTKNMGSGYNAFYIGNGVAIVLKEPNTTLQIAAQYVPQAFQNDTYNLYFHKQQSDWNNNPLYILDEWVAYINDLQATKELGLQPSGADDRSYWFAAYADAIVQATYQYDRSYSDWNNLVAFVNSQKLRVGSLLGNYQPTNTSTVAPTVNTPTNTVSPYLIPSNNPNDIVDLAPSLRLRNRQSSCVHATTSMALRWVDLVDLSNKWWNTYKGGESPGPHNRKLLSNGVKFAVTTDGDEKLLEYAINSRRGAGVTWGGAHCVFLAGRIERNGQRQAVILDNNRPNEFKYQEWNAFLREFKRCGGWAFVILSGDVPPPVPG